MRDRVAHGAGRIDTKRYNDVAGFLQIQHYEARWWRDACLTYFVSVNKHDHPDRLRGARARPAYYQNLQTTCPPTPRSRAVPPSTPVILRRRF